MIGGAVLKPLPRNRHPGTERKREREVADGWRAGGQGRRRCTGKSGAGWLPPTPRHGERARLSESEKRKVGTVVVVTARNQCRRDGQTSLARCFRWRSSPATTIATAEMQSSGLKIGFGLGWFELVVKLQNLGQISGFSSIQSSLKALRTSHKLGV